MHMENRAMDSNRKKGGMKKRKKDGKKERKKERKIEAEYLKS